MTRPSTPPLLSELRNASSSASQIQALRELKNEVIGHEQKKEMWIGLGVLTPLTRILNTHKGSGKRRHRDVDGSAKQSRPRSIRSNEEEARLQAIAIVGSLAHGGPAFIPPISASLAISPLLALCSPTEFSPHTVLASLKTLNAVADSLLLSESDHNAGDSGLSNLLYTEKHLSTLTSLLLQVSTSAIVQQQVALSAALISKTCRDENNRVALAQAGALEALTAALITCTACGTSGTERCSLLATILQTVGIIIQHSRPRSVQFLSAPALAKVSQNLEAEAQQYETRSNTWNASPSNGYNARQSAAIESMLPQLLSNHPRSSLASSNFPTGTSGKKTPSSRSFSTAIEASQSQDFGLMGEEESPAMVVWLTHMAKTAPEVTGLMAAWLLAILYRQGLTRRGRETTFAFLLIPKLVRMLDKDLKISPESQDSLLSSALTPIDKVIKEIAPAVLAMLTANNLEMQKAAADAGAIKKLSQLLKESYDPLPSSASVPMWTPETSMRDNMEARENISILGAEGQPPMAYHIMRLRESVLAALAAIASDKDDYRRAIIDNGVVPFVIKTLKPEKPVRSSAQQQSEETLKNERIITGNSKDAIIAACGAARALTRSVATLRTSLMDAGLPAPLFSLLKSQDIEFQVSATSVVTNLVLHFSPHREALLEGGLLKILCEHTRSMNSNLRLNSIWALKHLVLEASSADKKTCLEELGPGWLKQIITGDPEAPIFTTITRSGDHDDGSSTPIRMSTPNAAGEQVDLLNAVEEDGRDCSTELEEDGDEDLKMSDSTGEFNQRLNRQAKGYRPSSDFRSIHQGLSDELAIQNQAFDFIRNLICGSKSAEMIDYVFTEIGQEKLFELLAAKLRPRMQNVFNPERRLSQSGMRQIQPQTDIVISVCFIIVHIAAGNARHRQLVVSQSEILRLMVPLFRHAHKDVRCACVWTVINLTWVEGKDDNLNCKARAQALGSLGILEKLEGMENDEALDVRERCKIAKFQISQLLHQ